MSVIRLVDQLSQKMTTAIADIDSRELVLERSGLASCAALATVARGLVEVPVMLSLVAIANRTRNRFAAG